MTRNLTFAVLALVAIPFTAAAQSSESGPPVKDRAEVTFNEIERGFHLGLTTGASFLVNPPPGTRSFVSSGMSTRLEVGFDIGQHIAVALFGMLTSQRAPAEYIGKSNGAASGDFASITPGAMVRASLIGFRNDQGVDRVWLYLRGGVGYSIFYPRVLLPDNDVLVFAGPGVEYFTRLRHFSIGLEVMGQMLVMQRTFGFAVTPTLRYAF